MGTKNCPETARQKMINMMYLVLTAMLALNVAAETLHAFKIVDKSLMNTYGSFTNKNNSLLGEFNLQYELNQNKVEVWYEKAKKVNALSDSIISYIVETKKLLAIEAKAKPLEPDVKTPEAFPLIAVGGNDTLVLSKQDDLNASPVVMLTRGRGKELQSKILEYRDMMIEICDRNEYLTKNMMTAFDVEDPEHRALSINRNKALNFKTWVEENFQAAPVVAAITLLSKLQIDVRNAESAVLSHLYNQIDASSFKFTGLEAKVVPTSSYVFQGQEYQARIFLSAIDTTTTLTAYIDGRSQPLPVSGNEAILTIPATRPGPFTFRGEIRYKNPDGGEGSKPFSGQYQVAEPAATISPTKMNVLYQGVKNPISVSVPGIPSDKLEVSFNNGRIAKVTENQWEIEPRDLDPLGNKTMVTVSANIEGKVQKMGEMPFRVKRIPDPIATVDNMTGGTINRERLRIQRLVSAQLVDFDFDMAFDVTGFDLTVATSGGMTQTLQSNNMYFTAEMQQMLNTLSAGGKLTIENIKARKRDDPKDPERILSPIILTVR